MKDIGTTDIFDLITLVLASVLAGWLLLPHAAPADAQQYITPSVDVLSTQQIDLARRIGDLETLATAQTAQISNLRADLSSETATTRTAGGVLMSIIVILLAFNALKKFK